MPGIIRSITSAGPTFRVEISDLSVRNVGELEHNIAGFGQQSNSGLIVPPALFTLDNSELIIALAAKYRLPAIYAFRTIVASGGLLSYGVDVADQFNRAGGYVDRIFKGENAADLPVQAPTKFELTINLKTAKALGLQVSPQLLARADEVIE
jgi:putative ABC transport system substrate-binding protein